MIENITYIALLGNVNKSIKSIELGDSYTIEEWPTIKFVKFYETIFGSAEHDIWMKLDSDWGCNHNGMYRPKYVYVVSKEVRPLPPYSSSEDMEKWMEIFRKRNYFTSQISGLLNDKITKLRLWAEGSVKISVEVFYSKVGEILEMESAREEMLHGDNRLYKVKKSEIASINNLLAAPTLRASHKYINFALENFLQSYRVAHVELEFLNLMIGLEAIFNDGRHELRNKISRGCAVLLGKTKTSSRKIFKEVKSLYDKRSMLVHTGDKSKVTENDVIVLKAYLRSSIIRVLELNISKQQLANQLTENGFGSYNKIS